MHVRELEELAVGVHEVEHGGRSLSVEKVNDPRSPNAWFVTSVSGEWVRNTSPKSFLFDVEYLLGMRDIAGRYFEPKRPG